MSKRIRILRLFIKFIIIALILYLLAIIFFISKTKKLIYSAYDNYGVLPGKYEAIISEQDYSDLAGRVKDLYENCAYDIATKQNVYGKDYTEYYDIDRITANFQLFSCKVTYWDRYQPVNNEGKLYPHSYGDRKCNVTWRYKLFHWEVKEVFSYYPLSQLNEPY